MDRGCQMASRGMRHTCCLTDRDTVARIHEQVPGAPVIAKTLYRDRLAKAVKEAVAF